MRTKTAALVLVLLAGCDTQHAEPAPTTTPPAATTPTASPSSATTGAGFPIDGLIAAYRGQVAHAEEKILPGLRTVAARTADEQLAGRLALAEAELEMLRALLADIEAGRAGDTRESLEQAWSPPFQRFKQVCSEAIERARELEGS